MAAAKRKPAKKSLTRYDSLGAYPGARKKDNALGPLARAMRANPPKKR